MWHPQGVPPGSIYNLGIQVQNVKDFWEISPPLFAWCLHRSISWHFQLCAVALVQEMNRSVSSFPRVVSAGRHVQRCHRGCACSLAESGFQQARCGCLDSTPYLLRLETWAVLGIIAEGGNRNSGAEFARAIGNRSPPLCCSGSRTAMTEGAVEARAPRGRRDHASSMNVESGMATMCGSLMASPSSRVMSKPNGARLAGSSTNALMPRVSRTGSMLRR